MTYKRSRWYNYMSQRTACYCDSSAAVKPGLSMNILSYHYLPNGFVLEMLSSKQDTPTPWLTQTCFIQISLTRLFKRKPSLH